MTNGPVPADATATQPAGALPARRPGKLRTAAPRPAAEPPGDPLDRAWDVLAHNCDLPGTERGLLKVLAEYRRALHALATHVQAERGQQPNEPGAAPCRGDARTVGREAIRSGRARP
jgi:hypothetical protein